MSHLPCKLKSADAHKQTYMAIVNVCNIALYLAYVQGLFTLTKVSNLCTTCVDVQTCGILENF